MPALWVWWKENLRETHVVSEEEARRTFPDAFRPAAGVLHRLIFVMI